MNKKNNLRSQIQANFVQHESLDSAINDLSYSAKPHVILWYIGCHGLKQAGVDFYRNSVILPLWQRNPSTTFWLLDLTAWNAFKHSHGSIHRNSSCCKVIDAIHNEKLRCIRSSTIFETMCNIKDPHEIDFWKTALSRDFLKKSSEQFAPIHRLIGDIFPRNGSLPQEFSEWDAAKAYSMFQYLEAHLIIQEILANKNKPDGDLVFLLPNDELKYYQDSQNSFQADLCRYLLRDLTVNFYSFPYGTKQEHRPYNAPGPVVKKNHLIYESIVDVHESELLYVSMA